MTKDQAEQKVQDRIDPIYTKWQANPKLSKEDLLNSLGWLDRNVLLCSWLYSQVNNGGFEQWNSNGYNLDGVKQALRGINQHELADILEEIESDELFDAFDSNGFDYDEAAADRSSEELDLLDGKFYNGLDDSLIIAIAEQC